jgi:hypothetical protein
MSDERIPGSEKITSDPNDKRHNEPSQTSSKLVVEAQNILKKIKTIHETANIDLLLNYERKLTDLFNKDKGNHELFYLLTEGLVEIAKIFREDWEESFLVSILNKLVSFLEAYIEDIDFLTSISDAIVQVLEIVAHFEFYDLLEEYSIDLVNRSIDKHDNLVLRTLAAEVTIIAIKGFGDDWNYEKTREFDIILKGLLPPKEIDGFLAGILIKGLSFEINAYGDMHEFSSMKRTMRLMNELYLEQEEHDEEFLFYYSSGLVNAITWFGESEDYDEMMIALNNLAALIETHNEQIDIKITYANGLRIALDHCGAMEDLDCATKLAKQLLLLASDYPDNKEMQTLAVRGVFKAAIWAGAFWETGIITALLSNVAKILERFPSDTQLKILLGRGLFNLTKQLSLINKDKLMQKITNELAILSETNPAIIEIAQFYAKSIVNMTYMLSEFSDDFEIMKKYLTKAEDLMTEFDDHSVNVSYSMSLVNGIRAFGLHGKISEMAEFLSILEDYETTIDNFEVTIRLGKAYIDAIKVYGDINELDNVLQLYSTIKEWLNDDPHNIDLEEIHAKALVNIISAFGKNNHISEMVLYLDELRELSLLYPSLEIIQIQLAKGFSNSIRWYVELADLKRSMSLFNELKTIRTKFSDEISIQEMVARSARRIVVLAYRDSKFELVEDLLDNLRNQLKQLPNNETMQIELARALTNIIMEESSKEKSSYWQSLVNELKGLTVQYPNNTKLLAIHQTVTPLFEE